MSDIELRALEHALDDAAPWQDLPRELLHRILARLPTNEVPCTARLVCKAAAAALSSLAHTTVRLSQPSPHGEFARCWGAPGAMRPLTLENRRRLLALTAASGCLHNLAWLAEHVGCSLDGSVLVAAAAAGRLEACRWLLQQGCECGVAEALEAAAGAGQRSTLEALLAEPGIPLDRYGADCLAGLASCAARGGHVGLMYWLLERFEPRLRDLGNLFDAAAAGCDLATLQRLHLALQPQLSWANHHGPGSLGHLLYCAAASRTPDWRAKAEWVEACLGAPLDDTDACARAAACADAVERLTWLRARGCPWEGRAVTSAAGAGNVEALSYLLAEGCEVQDSAFQAAAAGGHVAALEVLHSHGLAATNARTWADAAWVAACEGQLPAVRWMLERQLIDLLPPAPGDKDYSLLGAAAESGSVELLAWLRAGGCPWGELDLYLAARGGSEEALEWAVAQGCPVQESTKDDDDPYLIAAMQGNWGTLACLRRLIVPWRPLIREGGTFAGAVRTCRGVHRLRRLLELGCPVDWVRAAEVAIYTCDEDMQTWLEDEEQRRREVEVAPQQQ